MPLTWPKHDPNDISDYGLNCAPHIDDPEDTIKTVTATVLKGDPYLIIRSAGVDPENKQRVIVWISDGQPGPAEVHLRVVTNKGRKFDQTMSFVVAHR